MNQETMEQKTEKQTVDPARPLARGLANLGLCGFKVVAMMDRVRMCVDVYGCVWMCANVSECVRLDVYGCVWICEVLV